MNTESPEKPVTLMDWEFQQHKEDLIKDLQKSIEDFMKTCNYSGIQIICGEYEAVIKRSES